jgi:ribonuclease HI
MFSLYFDGASRGNPGPASLGGVIYDCSGEEKINYKKSIGIATNNYAEYQALLVGIKVCIKYDIKEVNIYGDSKLAIEQVKGNWKVKSDTLRPIYLEIQKHITPEFFKKITFNHVRRHLNKRADELANIALDNA